MLTYSIVDRGTVIITGLEDQTGDKAKFQGEYYSDKLPGFPLLARAAVRGLEAGLRHSFASAREAGARHYWAADYWVTLFTSGLLTACTGALLVYWSRCLGCRAGPAALLGLAYGLATPAYVYATLAYGHQATAFALFASFFLLWKKGPRRRPALRVPRRFSGRLRRCDRAARRAGLGDPGPLPAGPVHARASAGLTTWRSSESGRRSRRLILLGYNQLAFGSPWEMGYFHHATSEFAEVHSIEQSAGPGVPGVVLGKARQPALGPPSRTHFLRADLALDGAGLGRARWLAAA